MPSRPAAATLARALVLAVVLGTGACTPAMPPRRPHRGHPGHPDYPATTPHPGLPPAYQVIDYQLGGGYQPADGVAGVIRDVTDTPADGLWSGCYVNGFQTQPAERDRWLTEYPDLVLRSADGAPVIDPGWPDELLLDTSTPERRAGIAAVLGPVIADCAARGFDAVELDNLDTWTRSDGRLTEDDAVAMATLLVDAGHRAGLAVGQKNAPDLGDRGRTEAGFDFAVAEECERYDECEAYTGFYGTAVIDIEYADDLSGPWSEVCADPQLPAATVLRDRDLTAPGDPEHVFDRC
ncbi:endo alpha-1,4 polygalactosaminidase [Cellulomonas denverensis]|uniref:endo alpha-1,4 polygalactosaminidase n=1 Tax=Cellulomonas denverensis TaxID=264297 RepID=UPI0035EAD6F4